MSFLIKRDRTNVISRQKQGVRGTFSTKANRAFAQLALCLDEVPNNRTRISSEVNWWLTVHQLTGSKRPQFGIKGPALITFSKSVMPLEKQASFDVKVSLCWCRGPQLQESPRRLKGRSGLSNQAQLIFQGRLKVVGDRDPLHEGKFSWMRVPCHLWVASCPGFQAMDLLHLSVRLTRFPRAHPHC